MKIRILLITLAMLQLLLPAKAVEVADLYVARLTEQQVQQLGEQKAKNAAFSQVLVRVSGKAAVLDNEIVRQQFNRLNNYLSQFGFIEDNGRRLYEVSFNPNAVNRLLRQADMPIWESKRPYSLVWLAQEQAGERNLVNEQSVLLQTSSLLELAQQRGLPLSFPLLDLDDLMQVSAADVWGNFTQPVLDASNRYQADQSILAKIYAVDDTQYQLSWSVYGKDNALLLTPWAQGSLTGELSELLPQWIDKLAEQYGERFAVQTLLSEADSVELQIYNLASLEQVLNAERLLRQLAMVSSVQLNQFDQNHCVFTIHILGRQQDLAEALALDPHLSPINSDTESRNTISYLWQM